MKSFLKSKIVLASALLASLLPTTTLAATADTASVNAISEVLAFPTGIQTNFDTLAFRGYISQADLALPTFKQGGNEGSTVTNADYNVISNKSYDVFISADKFKTSRGTLSEKVLAAERLKVKVGNGQLVDVSYKDPLTGTGSLTRIDGGLQTSLEGVTNPIDFRLDLSTTQYSGDGASSSELISALDSDANYTASITISLSTFN